MAAESANELGNTSEAQKDLEMVRARARGGNPDILPEITSLDQSVLREAIRHERRVELGLEFDRFYDLVRWGIAEQVLHAAGKLNYQPKNALLPLSLIHIYQKQWQNHQTQGCSRYYVSKFSGSEY